MPGAHCRGTHRGHSNCWQQCAPCLVWSWLRCATSWRAYALQASTAEQSGQGRCVFNVAKCDERVSDCSIAAPCAQQPTIRHGPSTGLRSPTAGLRGAQGQGAAARCRRLRGRRVGSVLTSRDPTTPRGIAPRRHASSSTPSKRHDIQRNMFKTGGSASVQVPAERSEEEEVVLFEI